MSDDYEARIDYEARMRLYEKVHRRAHQIVVEPGLLTEQVDGRSRLFSATVQAAREVLGGRYEWKVLESVTGECAVSLGRQHH